MQHPTTDKLQRYTVAQLDAQEERAVEEHLAECPECTKRVSDLERQPLNPMMRDMKAAAAASDSESVDYKPKPYPQSTEQYNPPPRGFSPGTVLGGNFRLEKQLGRGGMGEAWKAYDMTAERYVVLKFVPKEIQHVQKAMADVRDSFKKVHALQHQHICPVYGLFTDPEHGLYLVMKFIDGRPLNEYKQHQVEKHGKMAFSDVVQILWAIAKGLDYAHEKKVVHRDIKPQNVMIGKTDGVQIIDFGLAEEIRTSLVQVSEVVMDISGTRPYMAPEQWKGRLQDARTDQYALAVTAYELIAGHFPFQSNDTAVLRECVLHDDPEPIPGIPDHINAALLKALSKKRDDRFPDCKSFIKAIAEKPKAEVSVSQSNVLNLPSEQGSQAEPLPAWLPSVTMMETYKPKSSKPKTSKKPMPINRKNAWMVGVAAAVILLLGAVFMFPGKKPMPTKTEIASVPKSETPKTPETPKSSPPSKVEEKITGVQFSEDGKTLVRYPADRTATDYTIPAGVEVIGDGAFKESKHLVSVHLPNSVKEIGNDAFSRCAALESIVIPDSVTTLGRGALAVCEKLRSVTLSANLTTLERDTFRESTSLTSIQIPEKMQRIEGGVFHNNDGVLGTSFEYTFLGDPELHSDVFHGAHFPNMTFKAKKGTKAETFAKEKGIKFVEIK